jgi:hypothetical protein
MSRLAKETEIQVRQAEEGRQRAAAESEQLREVVNNLRSAMSRNSEDGEQYERMYRSLQEEHAGVLRDLARLQRENSEANVAISSLESETSSLGSVHMEMKMMQERVEAEKRAAAEKGAEAKQVRGKKRGGREQRILVAPSAAEAGERAKRAQWGGGFCGGSERESESGAKEAKQARSASEKKVLFCGGSVQAKGLEGAREKRARRSAGLLRSGAGKRRGWRERRARRSAGSLRSRRCSYAAGAGKRGNCRGETRRTPPAAGDASHVLSYTCALLHMCSAALPPHPPYCRRGRTRARSPY